MEKESKLVSHLNCRSCGAPIQPEWGDQVWTCPYCQSVQHLDIDWKKSEERSPLVSTVPQGEFQIGQAFPEQAKTQVPGKLSVTARTLFFIVFIIVLLIIFFMAISMMSSTPFWGDFSEF